MKIKQSSNYLFLLTLLIPMVSHAQSRTAIPDTVKQPYQSRYWPDYDWSKPAKGYTSHYWPEGYPSTAKENDVVNSYPVEKGNVYVLRNDRAVFIPSSTPAGTSYQISDLTKIFGSKFSKKSKTNHKNQKVYWTEIQFEEANSFSVMQIFTVGNTNSVQKIALANKYFAKKFLLYFKIAKTPNLVMLFSKHFRSFPQNLNRKLLYEWVARANILNWANRTFGISCVTNRTSMQNHLM